MITPWAPFIPKEIAQRHEVLWLLQRDVQLNLAVNAQSPCSNAMAAKPNIPVAFSALQVNQHAVLTFVPGKFVKAPRYSGIYPLAPAGQIL